MDFVLFAMMNVRLCEERSDAAVQFFEKKTWTNSSDLPLIAMTLTYCLNISSVVIILRTARLNGRDREWLREWSLLSMSLTR